MGHREKTPTVFTRFVYGLLRKRPPAIAPLSKSLGPPAPQTSLSTYELLLSIESNPSRLIFTVFELPDELILSILSYTSPDPDFASRYARFRCLYCAGFDNYHQQRVRCLRRLSMTCRAMWLRLLPWLWERLECLEVAARWSSEGEFPRKLIAIMKALNADTSLTISVRYSYLSLSLGRS